MEVLTPSKQEAIHPPVADATMSDLAFYHASEGKPLATPWQVAMVRAKAVAEFSLPRGVLLDCACGSGIQLAAYASQLKMPALGIELDRNRAIASCLNLNTIAKRFQTFDQGWHRRSSVLAGDGTASEDVIQSVDIEAVSYTHLTLPTN